jgi:hypothetical protein
MVWAGKRWTASPPRAPTGFSSGRRPRDGTPRRCSSRPEGSREGVAGRAGAWPATAIQRPWGDFSFRPRRRRHQCLRWLAQPTRRLSVESAARNPRPDRALISRACGPCRSPASAVLRSWTSSTSRSRSQVPARRSTTYRPRRELRRHAPPDVLDIHVSPLTYRSRGSQPIDVVV